MPQTEPRSKERLLQWLGSPEGQDVLKRVARAVLAYTRSQKLNPLRLDHPDLYNSDEGGFLEEIVQELSLFVLEKESLHRILALGGKNPAPYLRVAFINHLLDESRKKDRDPQRGLYRRAWSVISREPDFYTRAKKDRYSSGTSFTLSKDSIEIQPLCEEDLKEIPFPDPIEKGGALKKIRKKEHLLALARHFLKNVSEMYQSKPVWVDLRDFISWIDMNLRLNRMEPVNREVAGENAREACPIPTRPAGCEPFNEDLVKCWSLNLAEQLNEKERLIFQLYYGEEMTLEEVARQSGYSGPSGVKYRLERIKEKIRHFLRDRSWLSPDDLNEDAFSFFFNILLLNLKKSVPKP